MPGVLGGFVLGSVVFLGVAVAGQSPLTADDVARAIVIGQAYASGNVYVAGFVDDESRRWPQRIEGVPLQEGRAERIGADFFRTVVQDSEEQYYFPQREGDPADDDLFTTIDKAALEDRNLARYRAPVPVDRAVSFLGWDARLTLADVSYKQAGQPRPTSAAEREEVTAARAQVPNNVECSTEPQYLDAAKIVLTAAIAKMPASIRLSRYLNPGCAGHLSEIYVLDVIAPGQPSRRFEFRHYHGVL
jgi:hypothetical protein